MKRKTAALCFLLILPLLFWITGCRWGRGAILSSRPHTERTGTAPVVSSRTTGEESGAEAETTVAVPEETASRPASGPSGESAAQPPASAPAAVPSVSGALRVNGTQLTDRQGNAVQLRGISTHGLAWYPGYVNESCFRQLHEEWGINAIRLAMYTEEYGGYCAGGDREALKELIHRGVSCAAAQGMYVIIDWHILSDGNPNRHADEAVAFFDEMAARYAGNPYVIYEICNEPNGGTGWGDIKAYAERVIAAIRSHDSEALILVGTPNWSQYVDQAAADPITQYDNLLYTLHFYAATHTEALRNTMVAAIRSGLPVFVSEYGICDASGSGAIDEAQANRWIDLMDQYGVSYIAWNLSNKAETSAILRSDCQKTHGFEESDLSASGRWLYRMLTEKASVSPSTPPAAPSSASREESTTHATAPTGGTEGGLSCTAEVQNRWEADGQTFFQYQVTVHNRSGAACRQWQVNLTFNEPAALSDGWNGRYTASGTSLSIASVDYNGFISAGGSMEGIGFIVKGGPNLRITALS
ncbi:MAG: cellulase family glycosylhydrolase [Clostridiales bacterium]|nr:cellulase family glycosylhydrolase [Clostridiales bacterium]